MTTLSNLTDQELVRLYEQGNNRAFETLLYRYKDRVYNHIYGLVGDHDAAEDIFQETFFKAVVCIREGRYSETGRLGPWLLRIARNLVVDSYRRDRAEGLVAVEDMPYDLYSRVAGHEDSVEDRLVHEQSLRDVLKLINLLPENQQRIVRMRYFQNLSFKEIAVLEQISINTALGRMRYALRGMRSLAQKHGLFK